MMLVTAIPVPATADAIINMALDPSTTTLSLAWLAPFVWATAAFVTVLALTRRPKADMQPRTPATVTALETATTAATLHAATASWTDATPILDQATAARDRATALVRRSRNNRPPQTSTEATGTVDAD